MRYSESIIYRKKKKHAFDWVSPVDHDPLHIDMATHFAELFIKKAR